MLKHSFITTKYWSRPLCSVNFLLKHFSSFPGSRSMVLKCCNFLRHQIQLLLLLLYFWHWA